MNSCSLYHCALHTLSLALLVSNCMEKKKLLLHCVSIIVHFLVGADGQIQLYFRIFFMSLSSLCLLWIPVKQGKMQWKVWTAAEGTHVVGSSYQFISLLSYDTLSTEKYIKRNSYFVCVGFERQWQRRKNWRRAVTPEQLSFDRVFFNFRFCRFFVTISSALVVALILFGMWAAEMLQVTNEWNQQGCLGQI